MKALSRIILTSKSKDERNEANALKKKLRNQFNEIKSEAITIAEEWGINASFKKKMNRQTKKFFDELCADQRLTDPENNFKINQILSFRRVLLNNIKEVSSVKELAELLIVQNNCMLPSVPEVTTVLKLFLSIPVTSATAERSFSKLKLIKSYLRSTMGQQRLSDLSVLSIKNEKIRSLDINMLVDKFTEKNARRSQKFK
ncbi:hypothetical protein QTP88_017216 [Uroleucon formosanum]